MDLIGTSGTSPATTSPLSSPNTSLLLRRRMLEWSQETGSAPDVRIEIDGEIFNMHKATLVSKSGYFKKELAEPETSNIKIPDDFPGGSKTFEMAMLHCYSSPLPLDPFSVSALRCAADYLQMTEDYGHRNLVGISDLYLNQVVLQNWDDTLIVLQKCKPLLPRSEELLIVSRCVESLAFMSCMEILDPEQGRDQSAVTLEALAKRTWDCEDVKQITNSSLWIKDFIALPFEFFRRIIESMRRQGMREKYVSAIVAFYANKWVLSDKAHRFWENSDEQTSGDHANSKISTILQGIIDLLPQKDTAASMIPASFYFALVSRSLSLSLSRNSRKKLEEQAASKLYLARTEDFPFPGSSVDSISSSTEVKTMARIVEIHRSMCEASYSGQTPLDTSSSVSNLWDTYLSQVVVDPELDPGKFMELIQIIPITERNTHDHLYRAISTFLEKHPHISSEYKASVCKHLNCQKLSQEMCIHVVQDEHMPLRLVVQALFLQQLHTQKAFKDCSSSFRLLQEEFSGSLLSSRSQFPYSQNFEESPYQRAVEEQANLCAFDRSCPALPLTGDIKTDYESTSFRIQTLEQEFVSLKRILQVQKTFQEPNYGNRDQNFRLAGKEKRSVFGKRNTWGHSSSCIGSMSWVPQRKCANKLLKVIRRLAILGKIRWKTKRPASGLSRSPDICKSKHLNEVYEC